MLALATALVMIILYILIVLVIGLVLSHRSNKPTHGGEWRPSWPARPIDPGDAGEAYVRRFLVHDEAAGQYVLNEYRVRFGDTSLEIDHIVINQNGVFIIETKNLAGIITGREDAPSWMQTMPGGRTVNRLNNPIRQNEGHIRRIADILERVGICHNVVVILRADVRVESRRLISARDLPALLARRTDVWLSQKEVKAIYQVLCNYRWGHAVTREEHIANLRRMARNYEAEYFMGESRLSHGLCPRCGKPLRMRENPKHGRFWGCDGFPDCRYFKKIDP